MKKILATLCLVQIVAIPATNVVINELSISQFTTEKLVQERTIQWELVSTSDLKWENNSTIGEFLSKANALKYNNKYIELPSLNGTTAVTGIMESAFELHKHDINILGVKLPSQLVSIGDFAFSSNKIDEVVWPSTIKTIGAAAFTQNNLTTLSIPKSLSTLDAAAFSLNKISTLAIPADSALTEIGAGAFESNELVSLPALDMLEEIGRDVFRNNKITTLPSMNKIISIGTAAFENNEIVTVPKFDTLELIGARAFKNNKITSVEFSDVITEIDDNAFEFNSLTSLTIPASMTKIDNRVFKNNLITELTIPSNIISIGVAAFENNKITKLTINEGLQSLSERSFAYNELETVTLPKSFTSIGTSSFGWNKLTRVNYRGLTAIGWARRGTQYDPFNDNNLKDLTYMLNFEAEDKAPEEIRDVFNFVFPMGEAGIGIASGLLLGIIAAIFFARRHKTGTALMVIEQDGKPVKVRVALVAILPVNAKKNSKDAITIANELKKDFEIKYDDQGTISEREHLHFELGTKFVVIVGDNAIKDGYVQVRGKKLPHPERVEISKLKQYIKQNTRKGA